MISFPDDNHFHDSEDSLSPDDSITDWYSGEYTINYSLAGGLYLVATPIGNLRDITLRALDTLRHVSVIACEDTRIIRRLLDRYRIRTPLIVYHDHSIQGIHVRLMDRLGAGEAIALVSDAGTPLISDPGYHLVRDCIAHQISIVAVPGATAVITALILSGFPTDRFVFIGFLPVKNAERAGVVAALSHYRETLVIYESPRRVSSLLKTLALHMGERHAVVAREMTKVFENVQRGSIAELAYRFDSPGPLRGEVVIVIAPSREKQKVSDSAMVDQALRIALRHRSIRDAVAEVTAISGWSRRNVYHRAIRLTDQTTNSHLSHRRGQWGEFLGRWFLRLKGYRILARRFRIRGGEIDIIAQHGQTLVMVEVKERSNREASTYAVTPHQRRRLIRTARAFLSYHQNLSSLVLRFDVLIVIAGFLMYHIRDAFDMNEYSE